MGFKDLFASILPKQQLKQPLLNPEDLEELRELERKAYLARARELVKTLGEDKAEMQYPIKKEEVKKPW